MEGMDLRHGVARVEAGMGGGGGRGGTLNPNP